ncbi:unnamed protein product [Lactuca saligna]|uniref:Uncharacterized protein n=1 Tax=Lactuca saligna TaxID=75948 RepID=A0AA36E3Z7_LACSI|nr:unnamed protein product [Lactuca saligna]
MSGRPKVNRMRHVSQNEGKFGTIRVQTPRTIRKDTRMQPGDQFLCQQRRTEGKIRNNVNQLKHQLIHLRGNIDAHVERKVFEGKMKDFLDNKYINDDSLIEMMSNYEEKGIDNEDQQQDSTMNEVVLTNSEVCVRQLKPNDECDEVVDTINQILQGINEMDQFHEGNDEKCNEDVELGMNKTLDEVRDVMYDIFQGNDEKNEYENEDNLELEFTKGNASDILPKMLRIDIQYVEDGVITDGKMEGNEDDSLINNGVMEGNKGNSLINCGKGDSSEQLQYEAHMEGNNVDDEGNIQLRRTKKTSERIIL